MSSAAVTDRLVVIGAGTMGRGIAVVAAVAGIPTTLVDVDDRMLASAAAQIERTLAGAVERSKLTPAAAKEASARIERTTALAEATRRATVIIEAVVEDLDVKRRVFGQLEKVAPPDALLASNTSSLPITTIAAAAARSADRILGMHFFNPVHVMKLVEIVTHAATSHHAVERASALARLLGKEPIVVRDSPGFASSRLGIALGLEAMRMLQEGVATAQDIDTAMELGYGHAMGPLRVSDVVGLDVRLDIATHLHRTLGSRYEPPRVLREKVAAGELGKKSGKGFYEWPTSS